MTSGSVRWVLSTEDGHSHAVTGTSSSPIGTVTARCGRRLPAFEPSSSTPHPGAMCQDCGTSVLNDVIAPPEFPTSI